MDATKSSLAIKIKAPGRSGRSSEPEWRLRSSPYVYADVRVFVSSFMRANVTVFIHLLKDYESNLNSAKARRRVIFHVLPEIKAIFYGLRARAKLKFSPSFLFASSGSFGAVASCCRGGTCRNAVLIS